MKQLDNKPTNEAKLPLNVSKTAILLMYVFLLLAANSCRKSAPPVGNPVVTRPSAEAIAEADRFYEGRADLMKVREGIVALRQAQAGDPSNYDLAWRLAKFNYYLGAHSTDETEKEKAFRDGVEAGKLALQFQGDKPEGHFWLGANYGGSAQLSILSGLSEIEDIKREMEAVLSIDPGYESGSAYMVLGQVYLQSPRILGGDTQKAIEYLKKGLRLGPNNALLRWHLAEAYAQAHQNDEARKQIDALLTMKPALGYEPEHNEAVAEARKLQEKLK